MLTIRGIILNRKNFQSFDRRIVFFTREKGKMIAYAKGAQKTISKLAPHLEPLLYSELMIASGKKVQHIAGACIMKSFMEIRSNVQCVSMATRALRAVELYTKEQHPEPKAYAELEQFLNWLEHHPRRYSREEIRSLVAIFTWRLIAFLGYYPRLFSCAQNHSLQGPLIFSAAEGGVVCARCMNTKKGALALSKDSIQSLQFLLQGEISDIFKRAPLNNDQIQIIRLWYQWHLK